MFKFNRTPKTSHSNYYIFYYIIDIKQAIKFMDLEKLLVKGR